MSIGLPFRPVASISLQKLAQPGKGSGWSLQVGEERLRLADPAGRIAADLTAEDAAQEVKLPGLDAAAGEIRIPCDGAAAKFLVSREDLSAVRLVVMRGVIRGGPAAIRKFRRPARRRVVVGALALVLAALPSVLFPVALLLGKSPSFMLGGFWISVFALGIVEIGRGRAMRREADRLIREAERAESESGSLRGTAMPDAAATARAASARPRRPVLARDDEGSPVFSLVILWVLAAGLGLFAVVGALAIVGRSGSWFLKSPARSTVAQSAKEPAHSYPAPPPPVAREAPEAAPVQAGTSEPAPEQAAAAPPAVTLKEGISGACEWAAPVRSLKPGGLASDSRIRVIRERAGVVLTTNLRCDATEPGSWAGKIRSGGHIAAGTKVMSFLIHANGSGRGTLHLSGGVTFETPILGLIIGNELLDASDGAVGLEGVEYPHGGQLRGWFDGDGDDRITLSEDRRTVSVVSHTGRWVDQVRVITAADR